MDIVAKASDSITYGGGNAGIYEIGYEILDEWGTVYGPIFNLTFDDWLDSLYINTVYAPGSNTSNFYYIVTNNMTSNDYWDVDATVDPGVYTCRIHAYDIDLGYQYEDVSIEIQGTGIEDEVFVTVTSPNGGEEWEVGSEHNITWCASAYILGMDLPVDYVMIYYSTDGGWEYPYTINDTIYNTGGSVPWYGSYSWTVPYTPSEYCKVGITATWGLLCGSDVSDYCFTIYPDTIAPEPIDDLSIVLWRDPGPKPPTDRHLRLSWTEPYDSMGVTRYVVYRNTVAYSLGDSLDGTTNTTWTDFWAAGDPSTNYFYMVKAVDGAGNKSSASNEVGEFDIYLTDVKKSKSPDGFNMVSWPLIVHDTAIQPVLAESLGYGCQLTGGNVAGNSDQIEHFDGTNWYTAWYKDATPPPGALGWKGDLTTVEPDKGYWIIIETGHPAVTLTMTGGVNTDTCYIPIAPGPSHNYVGTCWPVSRPLSGTTGDDCNLIGSGFTGGYPSANSDKVRYFDGSIWYWAWYKVGGPGPSNVWKGGLSGTQTAGDPYFDPGHGYVIDVLAGHAFTDNQWVYPPPPAKGSEVSMVSKPRTPVKREISKIAPRALSPSTNRSLDPKKAAEVKKTR